MVELVALVAAIAMIIVVLMLRAMFALPFPRHRARLLAAKAPAGTATLFEEAFTALKEQGFDSPQWMLFERVDGEPANAPLRAVLRHPESGGLVCLAPPPAAKHPHQLLTFFCHRLADGRLAFSQAYDCYFEQTQTEEIVAQTLALTNIQAQWQAHCAWLSTLGETVSIEGDEAVLDAMALAYERQRQALIARGELRQVNANLALPRLRFALRLLRAYLRTPAPPPDRRAVPPARLGLLARNTELARHRAPPKRVQWALFSVSVMLFMLLGAIIWDVQFAVVILLVVLFHELGHFLAMRAFGFRNTHILALPLVGGVAMGHDANPNATRSAWMSLMGPLPGIVLGWSLLLANLFGMVPEWASEWVMSFAIVALLVNYLNVLPIPPLDGAHVVQSLLPRRWARLRTIFVAVACVLGAIVAWMLGFWILVALPLLQLMALPMQWQLHRVEDELHRMDGLKAMHEGALRLRIFETMETVLGPSHEAAARVEQGLQLASSVRTEGMQGPARVLTGGMYLALLVVPVVAMFGFAVGFGGLMNDNLPDLAHWEQRQAALEAQAHALSMSELVAGLRSDGDAPSGATAVQLAAARERLGVSLPRELRELYAMANGLELAQLRPIELVTHADAALDSLRELSGDAVTLYEGDSERHIQIDTLSGWLLLGGEGGDWLLFDPTSGARNAGMSLLWIGELGEGEAHVSLRAWLEQSWMSHQSLLRMESERESSASAAREAMRDASMPELLSEFERPSWLVRLIASTADWPGPAPVEAVDAAERRLERQLPRDYRELLATHNGFPPLQLLPIDQVHTWRSQRDAILPDVIAGLLGTALPTESDSPAGHSDAPPVAPQSARSPMQEADLASCLILASFRYSSDDYDSGLQPQILLCPSHSPRSGLLDLSQRRNYPNLRAWVLERAAQMRAVRHQFE